MVPSGNQLQDPPPDNGLGAGTIAGAATFVAVGVGTESVRVEITAERLPSSDWYDAVLRSYSDSVSVADGVFLASVRFSPGQDGKLDWKARVQVPPDRAGKTITRVLVTVARDK